MFGKDKRKNEYISRQNISYYDGIAAEYDAIMYKDAANSLVRAKVAKMFTSLVRDGVILDFGGGTGQDLEWLLQYYNVIFCEPSPTMRRVAIERDKASHPYGNITFLNDDQTDFRTWNTVFPIDLKLDAILANFAVINCVPDIDLLFEKLAWVIKPGGVFVALILDRSVRDKLKLNVRGTLWSALFGSAVSFRIEHNGKPQIVYIHSVKAIKRAISGRFEYKYAEQLQGSGFRLIQLERI